MSSFIYIIDDVQETINRYKKVEGKPNFEGTFDLYFTRVIQLFG